MKILHFLFVVVLLAVAAHGEPQQARGTLIVEVRSGSKAVSQVEVIVGDLVEITNNVGEAVLRLAAGDVEVTVQRFGFTAQKLRASIQSGTTTRLSVQLVAEVVRREEITVTATRTEQRIEDVPIRVEVLQQEEIEEKALMTPGDVAMLLNETSGLLVCK